MPVDPVFIVGMGRSGTSAVSSVVKELGFDMGGNIRMDEYDTWENPEVLDLNRSILAELGYGLYDPPPAIYYQDLSRRLQDRAEALVEAQQAPWAWKDGHLAYTFDVFSALTEFKVVGVMRNPVDVGRRDNIDPALMARVWPNINGKILRQWVRRDTMIVQYEQLMAKTRQEVGRIAEFCEVPMNDEAIWAVRK